MKITNRHHQQLNQVMVKVILGGGLDLVFNDRKQLQVDLREACTVTDLIATLISTQAQGKKQMFAIDNKIRPGILVLVNDVDWELLDKEKTELGPKDEVVFISTLHGG